MSGHSKWSTIKRKKGANDAQRAKIFTKIAREIIVAVKAGGPDPDNNSSLKDAIAKARSNNMPNDNINRTIKKAAGDTDGDNYESITYEGYGPAGVAVIVNALTDNRNRTAADVRHAFDKNGGNMGQTGCVSFMFDQKGIIIIENEDMDEDEITMDALEAGADDIEVPVEGGEYIKSAKIGRAIMDADIFISLSHFKGHETTGFGGAIKNIGMGCGSRAGKKEQHTNGQPTIHEDMCRGCRRCMRECANNGLLFDEETKKMHIDGANCVGCGRCIGACNFDAIEFENWAATKDLNCRMAEYTKAVVDGRPNFHISLVVDVSPNCDCHAENDAPILPNIGMFASFDPLALDQACVDACLKMQPLPNSQLSENMHKEGFCDHHDHFENSTPESEYKTCLEHAEKIGLGSREYELIVMK